MLAFISSMFTSTGQPLTLIALPWPGLVDVEHGLDGRVEALHVQRLVDRPLGLAQGERRHLGDLLGQRPGLWLSSSSRGTTRFTMPVRSASSAVIAPTSEQDLLGLARAEFPGVAVVFDSADTHQHHRIGEQRVVGGQDQVAWPAQQQAAGDAPALNRGDRRLGHIAPAQRVFEIAPALVLMINSSVILSGTGPPPLRSWPAEKCLPLARSTITATSLSSAARVHAASSSSRSSDVLARWRPRAG